MLTRENNFDFLRLFFAVLVIFSHSFLLVGADKSEPFFKWTGGQETGGGIAVDCFFILSGYLITASFLRSKSVWIYLGKRFRRIFPGLLAAYIVGAWIVPIIAGFPLPYQFTPTGIFHFLGMAARMRSLEMPGAFAMNPVPDMVNSSLWTIPYEFGCYVLIAALGAVGIIRRRRALLGAFTLSLVIGATIPLWTHALANTHIGLEAWARFIPFYLAGTVAWVFRDELRFTPTGFVLSALAIVTGARVPFAWNTTFAIAGTYLLLAFANASSIPLHSAGKYGDFSYGVYLYAWPVQQYLIQFTRSETRPLSLFLAATLLTMPLAILSWYLIEKPALRGRTVRLCQCDVHDVPLQNTGTTVLEPPVNAPL